MFSISDIRSAVKSGVAKSNKYMVVITSPFAALEMKKFAALCETSELPGKGISTVNRYTYGPIRKMPMGLVYGDLTMSFICTNTGEERTFFDIWQGAIVDPTSNYLNYYDSYTVPIAIIQFNDKGEYVYASVLLEAYPIAINPQPLSYSKYNEYMTVDVTFAYRKWLNMVQLLTSPFSSSGVVDSLPGNVELSPLPAYTEPNMLPQPQIGEAGNILYGPDAQLIQTQQANFEALTKAVGGRAKSWWESITGLF